ncbi:MAG: hypothetical protein A3H70_02540 [Candidatus Komeilibacteria bacterium RIFCSPLOWO2_02_FULL_48_11]|uniref:Bacterial type II secretion system protein E domain-containing protein n=1 Tax=Candidatus Komeilibacteria bacterium RIFCSPLOWO2_02_FULL_48_11 TaxID=1798553 RepID=A0A1G2BRJ1_9BACT|nr:MAG: hypothetical protein A3H70_02540 [Candidatus Komeilibacteria bacterium RIFCSPLOWO2_02_FULL_48_11]
MLSPLLQFLAAEKVITPAMAENVQLESEKSGQPIDDLLTARDGVPEEVLLAKKGELYHLPTVDLTTQTIKREALELFPKEIVSNYQIVPFQRQGEKLSVALVHPENLKAREAADFLARQEGWDTSFYVATSAGLKHALDQYANLSKEVAEALVYIGAAEEKEAARSTTEAGLEEVVKSAPVSKMVNVILRHAIEGKASDIHIEPGENDSRVRYRIDGILHTTLTLPKYIHASVVSRIKVLANLKLDETRKPQDGRIHVRIEGREVDVRVSTMPLIGSEKVVMRILDVTSGAPKLQDLGFMGHNLKEIEDNIHEPNGLFLVTGPTGSGKSTTLFACLSILNQEGVNIVTLEDPVEYFLAGANQAPIRPEVGFTFASGLRSILRQDPDIIMVGEIRDNETAELAVQAALTGHIVLSTLHTNDAVGAVPRLLDMKVESFLLASTINVLIAQRLVRRICQNCKEKATVASDIRQVAERVLAKVDDQVIFAGVDKNNLQFYRGQGCAKCGGTGFEGRLSICEVIANTRNLQQIINKGFALAEVEAELKEQGFISMMQDGIMKALLGLTTVEEVVVATKE